MRQLKKRRTKPKGIFVYCTEEDRERIDRVRRWRHTTISGYVLEAALHQVERDEAAMRKKEG